MLKNYLLVALRNLRRNKLFSLINVLGLAIGISASLIIFLIVRYDFSFDRFEKDGDRIYRIVSDYGNSGNGGHTRGVQAPLASVVRKELPGPDLVVSFRYYNAGKLVVHATTFQEPEHLIFADSAYFRLLPYQWLAGSPKTALAGPGNVVLSESRARLYFPTLPYSRIIGQTLLYDDTIPARVSGIVSDLDSQYRSDFNFKEFISLATVLDDPGLKRHYEWDDWGGTSSDQQLYVRLGKAVNPATVDAKLKLLVNKYLGEDMKNNHFTWIWRLQPLSDLHFNSHYGNFDVDLADKDTLFGLMLVAVFILLLACINFINLTTAQAAQRAREIGIRKTIGGSRRQLIFQFLSETFLITLTATLVSILLTPLLLGVFADFIPKGLHFSPTPSIVAFLALLIIVVGSLAGTYPALVLSSYKPLLVLKNQAYADTGKTRRAWVRQGLIVSQFVIAQFFIIGTLLVAKQIHYLLDRDLGFQKQGILSFNTPSRDTASLNRSYLVERIERLPGVQMVSLGSDVPFSWGWWTQTMDYKDGKKAIHLVGEVKAGDSNYLRLFHIPLLAGRDLLPSDTAKELVINQAFLHALGFTDPQAALGKMIDWDYGKFPVVGVMKDFNAHALSISDIKPMAFCRQKSQSRRIIVALRQPVGTAGVGDRREGWQQAIAGMKAAFAKTYPQAEFSYNFLDESIASAYDSQQKISRLLNWAMGITVFISCLGLLGLVVYVTNHRTKEIGIRKVLGASVAHIVSILSKEFLLLVAIAFAVATPLAWWAGHHWLDDFVYRTSLSWWVFVAGGIGMTVVSLLTLSLRTIRAAMANPVKSLRTE